jgi:CRISPR-associated protein (TIGR03984 family)
MSGLWLIEHARDVAEGPAWVLFQGYPASGFGSVVGGKLLLGVVPDMVTVFEPAYYWSVRLFGEKGEWHCWRDRDGWQGRLATVTEWPDRIERRMALWGTGVASDESWHTLTEARGAVVRLPRAWRGSLIGQDLPVLLEIWERIEPEEDTGLTGVVDAMLRGFQHKSENREGRGL